MATLNELTTPMGILVYLATHGGDGNRLPYMKRSFISFSFGEKDIEDFNLIATTVSNSINRSGYAQFNDLTTSYDILDGQLYWGTHYTNNQIDFTLATDGIDLKKLDEFLLWFRAGDTKELILAEHPNRAIYARVAEPPQLNLLPFEGKVEVKILSGSYYTSTTLYKGEIELKFIMDEPFWHGKTNILGIERNNTYVDEYYDISKEQEISIFSSKDALKILYEDGIPLGSMILNNMLFGDAAYAKVENEIISYTWDPSYSPTISNSENLSGGGACTEDDNNITGQLGIIIGALIDATGNGIESLSKNTNAYFFYAGTAPSPTIILFTFTPTFSSSGYINNPYNSYFNTKYNILTIESTHKLELRFTTPNFLTSYNKAIDIIRNQYNKLDRDSLCLKIRTEVHHQAVREWAVKVLGEATVNNNNIINSSLSSLILSMKSFLIGDNETPYDITVKFNSETGQATGSFTYKNINLEIINKEEDVGDMLLSNYIILRDRNYPTQDGSIRGWTTNHKEWSHRIKHDLTNPIKNLTIVYLNMYL